VFNEPAAADVAARLSDSTLVAPALLDFELANVCVMKARRRPASAAALVAAFRDRDRLRIETIEVDHAEVVALAQRTGLTAYDASYLWVARTLGVGLITLDRQLAEAAGRPS